MAIGVVDGDKVAVDLGVSVGLSDDEGLGVGVGFVRLVAPVKSIML